MSDFGRKQPAPQGGEAQSMPANDQGGASPTGFADAPLTPQDRGAAGPGVPANARKIR